MTLFYLQRPKTTEARSSCHFGRPRRSPGIRLRSYRTTRC
ncbi:hypothetical protein LSAT2_011183, partial [Lamellibrachia satsuma]